LPSKGFDVLEGRNLIPWSQKPKNMKAEKNNKIVVV